MLQTKIIGLVFLVVTASPVAGQTNKYKILVEHETKGVARNFALLVNGENVITNDGGIINLTLNAAVDNVLVQSFNKQQYVIRYPDNGTILLPRNPQDVIRVLVGEPSSRELSDTYKKKIAAELLMLQKKLDSINVSNETLKTSLLKKIDSLLAEAKKNNINEEELRTEREMMLGRDQYFPEISAALAGYVNEARDLNDAFSNLSLAFSRREAYDQLIQSIKNYNEVYEKLNAHNTGYEKAITDFWKSRELGYSFHNLMDFALNEIHRPYVLPLNDVSRKINEYYTLTNKRDKRTLKQEILNNLDDSSRQLSRRIIILAEKANTIITILKSDS